MINRQICVESKRRSDPRALLITAIHRSVLPLTPDITCKVCPKMCCHGLSVLAHISRFDSSIAVIFSSLMCRSSFSEQRRLMARHPWRVEGIGRSSTNEKKRVRVTDPLCHLSVASLSDLCICGRCKLTSFVHTALAVLLRPLCGLEERLRAEPYEN